MGFILSVSWFNVEFYCCGEEDDAPEESACDDGPEPGHRVETWMNSRE